MDSHQERHSPTLEERELDAAKDRQIRIKNNIIFILENRLARAQSYVLFIRALTLLGLSVSTADVFIAVCSENTNYVAPGIVFLSGILGAAWGLRTTSKQKEIIAKTQSEIFTEQVALEQMLNKGTLQ
jgi:hypothetical protein